MIKFCSLCKQDKSIIEFAKNRTKRDGFQNVCKVCQRLNGKARYQLTKKEHAESNTKRRIRNQIVVYEYLKTHPCTDCFNPNPVVLTFDHVRGVKRANLSDMVKQSLGLKTIFEEIEKCEVRCFNCHMIKDSLRRGGRKWNALNAEIVEKTAGALPL